MKKKMNKQKIIITVSALLLSSVLTLAVFGSAGTVADPLVTVSYLNGEYKQQLISSVVSSIGESYLDEIKAHVTQQVISGGLSIQPSASSEGYEVVYLTAGQRLYAASSCEIILRSGSAIAIIEDPVNVAANVGLSDCTSGKEILHASAIPQRHLLIIPRADGRGVAVTSADAYFMVRGDYEIG